MKFIQSKYLFNFFLHSFLFDGDFLENLLNRTEVKIYFPKIKDTKNESMKLILSNRMHIHEASSATKWTQQKVELIRIEKMLSSLPIRINSCGDRVSYKALCWCMLYFKLRRDRLKIDLKKRAHSHKDSSAKKLHYLAS